MKKICALLLLFVSVHLSAQRPLVLIEEFTNTGCNPCASWSPLLDQVIEERLGDCIAIKYHSGYPDSNDEFYNYDKTSQQARIDFYGVTGVPTTFVNGMEIGERTTEMMHYAIDYFLGQPSIHSLSVSKLLNGHHLTVQTSLTPHTDIANVADLRLFVAVIEEHIVADKPYPNGEIHLNYTLRKMLTGGSGMQLAEDGIVANQTYTYDTEWDIDFAADLGQLGVVAFVQDMNTKEVVCTAYASPGAEKENNLALMSLNDTPDLTCLANYYGNVIFRNDGANILHSAMLNVEVNGSTRQYPWSGELGYLQRDTLTFDDFRDFTLAADKNQVSVWFSDVNGTDSESNRIASSFDNSYQASYSVQLRLYTDKKPEETTWKLYNSAGDVVHEGGPYPEARKFYTENLNTSADDCYLLEFEDAGGDGIKGAYGNGYYQLFQVDGEGHSSRITQGDYEGSVCDVFFHLTGTPTQDRRLVLFEEFTNTSCDPCSEFSPALDKTIYERMNDMVAITYHINFPSNRDPFYLANPDDAMTRAAYYDATGVPALRVDGERAGAWGHEAELGSYIDMAGNVPAEMGIDTEAALDNGLLTTHVSLTPTNISPDADLRLFVAVVEERVEWDSPAPNGEKSWNYVMRKLLPSADGQPLPADMPLTVPTTYDFEWMVANFYEETELGIVTFVQDLNTKKVLGACYTPRPSGSSRDAKILKILNTPARICQPSFSADLVVRNTGRETLTQANLNVRVNGTVQQTPWTGRLGYLGIDTLHTPDFNQFELANTEFNEVEIWLSNLNGGEEESLHKTLSIAQAYQAQNAVRLTLMTDNAPGEISWKVYDSAGEVACQGGPYAEARKKQVVDLPLTADDCYLLVFEDAGGNGITGENGRGYYMLHEVDAEGKIRLLVQADYTGVSHEVPFSLQNAGTSGICHTSAEPTQKDGRWFDLQGRQVDIPQKGVYIQNRRKTTKH